jgi:radical SAM superfamily enzyme YgiQ (UPF0313 family)
MELNIRKGADAFVPAGAYRQRERELAVHTETLAEIPAAVVCCLDMRARMLPFVMYDRHIFPAGGRIVAGALHQAGLRRTRAVFQLWNPRFRPSQAKIDGRPIQLLLVSSMHLNGEQALAYIRDAWTLGDDRPLIIAGGAQAHYEPYRYWPLPTPSGPVGPDVVCTGEVYVLLDLLRVLLPLHRSGEHIRRAFERARLSGALDCVPGLVYLAPEADFHSPTLVDTGLQRLVQHFDELPDDVHGLSLLEPPHRRSGLSAAPLADKQVGSYARVCGLQLTQGCKFTCAYCPIPALNQKTWRFRSPEGLVRQFRMIRERYGIKYFFGTDDNFFNRRQTALEYFEALARARMERGKRVGHQVRWGTEATQHDTWKNRDLLPLAHQAGLKALWFGIEDLTAELVNKGQRPEVTAQLFPLLHRNKIMPMPMLMFHDMQPFESPGSLRGIGNQIDFLRQAGALTVQVTLHTPAIGTRLWEPTFKSGRVLKTLGNTEITVTKYYEGNHVNVVGATAPWLKQLQWIAAYLRFYNPLNLLRAMRQDGSPLRWYRMGYQVAGMLAAVRTAWKTLPYVWRLLVCKKTFHTEAPPISSVPVRLASLAYPRLSGNMSQGLSSRAA